MPRQGLPAAHDERRWNRLATRMHGFHAYLMSEFDSIYNLADGKYTERGLTLQQYLRQALEFRHHLEMHHDIEERYIFPVLAQRMAAFADNQKHRNAHRLIHEGLDRLSTLIARYQNEPVIYSPVDVRDCLNSFRDVLVSHLAEEEKDLSGENMKQYYTLEEVDRLPL